MEKECGCCTITQTDEGVRIDITGKKPEGDSAQCCVVVCKPDGEQKGECCPPKADK